MWYTISAYAPATVLSRSAAAMPSSSHPFGLRG